MARQQAARKGSRSEGGTAAYEEELAEYLQERIKPNLNRGSIPLLARSIAKDLAKRQRPDDESEETMQDDEPRDKADEEYDDEPRDEEELDEEEPEAEADEDFDEEELDEEEPEAEEDEDFDDEADEEEPEAEEDEDFDEEADEEEPEAEADEEEPAAEADEEEPEAEAEDAVSAFEEEMHQLQEDLGEDWIVRFSVQGDEAWLTAEKEDGSQHVEGPTADVLREAVELLEEGGGRSD